MALLPHLRRRLALAIWPGAAPADEQDPPARAAFDGWRDVADILELDDAYWDLTAVNLTEETGPAYDGVPPIAGQRSGRTTRAIALSVLDAARGNLGAKVNGAAHYQTLCYFSAIWPEGAEWPVGIVRPAVSKGGA
ncbi:MAG: hypothetical protein R3D60_13060 [Paracoccaceae bacterium]